jgi:hypothetical protein
MTGGSVFRKILYSSWFLAVIAASIIILSLPSFGTKSRLQVEPFNVYQTSENITYTDLDSDGISEVVNTGKGNPYFYLVVLKNDFRVFDQWNLQDSIDLNWPGFFFGNYDNDRYKEICIFTHLNDSLFLNVNEFFDTAGTKLNRVYITKIGVVNKQITSIVSPAGFFDTNGDGKDELFFSIHTGFGLQPRKLYSFDIAHNELKSSQLSGVICQKPMMVDSDGDGRPEIFGFIGASGNYHTYVPYSDCSSWLMVFNDSLKFEFPPVEFPGLTNILYVNAYNNGRYKGYVVLHYTGSADSEVLKPRIMLFSLEGKKIREWLFSDLELTNCKNLVVLKNKNTERIYLLGEDLLEFNDHLEVIKRVRSGFNSEFKYYQTDIDFDGEDELILYSENEEKLVIYNLELQKVAETRLKAAANLFRFSHYASAGHENKIFLNSGKYGYYLQLKSNTYYYLDYLAYPCVYLIVFLFILLIKRINTYQVINKESLNRRLVTLQLQGIKTQLDPHFTFNALNSIASLIYLEDRQAAYDYISKYSQLLRRILNDAEKNYRSLGAELDLVTTYLDLEKLRFGDKFSYEISVGKGITQAEQVPKMVLHTFAENAIKHGIMPCNHGGLLKIRIELVDDCLRLIIEDNGVGRAGASATNSSSGKGLKTTWEFYDILNQLNNKPIRHLISDLYNEKGDPAGTIVEVLVPLKEYDL